MNRKQSYRLKKLVLNAPPPPERPEAIVDKAELLIKWLDEAGTFFGIK